MPTRIGRLNLAATAQYLKKESRPADQAAPPAPSWVVPTGASVLRRKITSISTTSADIDTANGGAAVKKGRSLLRAATGSKNSLFKISRLLDLLQQASDDETALFYLGGLVVMCEHWLDRHKAADNPKLAELIEDVYAEARRDRTKALAQQEYVQGMKFGETAKYATGRAFTQQIGVGVSDAAENNMRLANRDPSRPPKGAQKRIADLINSAGLTQAEVAAVITYTASDYLYINPATANSDSWLSGQQGEIKKAAEQKGQHQTDHLNQKQMKTEGATHAGVLMQALAKMPVKQGVVYRGARMNQKEFDEAYRRQTQIVYRAFTSTSVDLATCKKYASGASERPPRRDQTISVKAILQVTDGRDVKELSDAGGENEWLLKPGATFKVTKIEEDPEQDPGPNVKAKQWKIVYLQQVPNGEQAPMRPARGAPQIFTPSAQALAKLGSGDFSRK